VYTLQKIKCVITGSNKVISGIMTAKIFHLPVSFTLLANSFHALLATSCLE
jgi:hypothetical protein